MHTRVMFKNGEVLNGDAVADFPESLALAMEESGENEEKTANMLMDEFTEYYHGLTGDLDKLSNLSIIVNGDTTNVALDAIQWVTVVGAKQWLESAVSFAEEKGYE